MSEFEDVEELLRRQGVPEPSAALREEVLGRVRAELKRSSRRRAQWNSWRLAAGSAAAVLLWLNLSMSAANVTEWRFENRAAAGGLGDVARQVRELLPELTEAEALGQALRLRGRDGLKSGAAPAGVPVGRQLEEATWDSL